MSPLIDMHGELCHIRDAGDQLVVRTLKHQYRSEKELLILLNLIETLEKVGLM